jgi:hypothetical protein
MSANSRPETILCSTIVVSFRWPSFLPPCSALLSLTYFPPAQVLGWAAAIAWSFARVRATASSNPSSSSLAASKVTYSATPSAGEATPPFPIAVHPLSLSLLAPLTSAYPGSFEASKWLWRCTVSILRLTPTVHQNLKMGLKLTLLRTYLASN